MQEELLSIVEDEAMVERSVKRCERWLKETFEKNPEHYEKEIGCPPDQVRMRLHSVRYILCDFTEEECRESIRITLLALFPDQIRQIGRFNCEYNMYGGLDNIVFRCENMALPVL
ncbi:MAG: hypothetical protein IJ242_17665 [Clostridia bacterium]|nr:hypothetical protein [Clostridia bacterium]